MVGLWQPAALDRSKGRMAGNPLFDLKE